MFLKSYAYIYISKITFEAKLQNWVLQGEHLMKKMKFAIRFCVLKIIIGKYLKTLRPNNIQGILKNKIALKFMLQFKFK